MARRMNFRQPIAIATTRSMPRTNKVAIVGLAVATAASLLVSPLLALGLVGLMLWQAFSPE